MLDFTDYVFEDPSTVIAVSFVVAVLATHNMLFTAFLVFAVVNSPLNLPS
ncbi:hypothetical protein C8J56DRAFT_1037685 [Mycena floridula]|nr:hypothetical protein C8J56DRAFT_1037685 [Mycena floridula]